MTLTELYNATRSEAYKTALERWSAYLQERSKHEELQETVRVFTSILSREANSEFEEFTPLTINGFTSTSSGTTRTNEFLRDLCRDLDQALHTYQRASDPISEYLNSNKQDRAVAWLTTVASHSILNPYLPDAHEMADFRIAEVLGRYKGLRDAIVTVSDDDTINTGRSDNAAAITTDAVLAKKQRTQVILFMMLLKYEHDIHISTRSEQKEKGYEVGFNQEHLAEVLAVINRTSDVSSYKNTIRDVLDLYGKRGSMRLLESTRRLIDYIGSGHYSNLREALDDEIEILDLD